MVKLHNNICVTNNNNINDKFTKKNKIVLFKGTFPTCFTITNIKKLTCRQFQSKIIEIYLNK